MQSNKDMLKKIAQYRHRWPYGSSLSVELTQVFRIKNLFLFAFKLLQKYEQVSQSACAQIKKSALMKQLHLAEEEIRSLEIQIDYWKNLASTVEKEIKDLRQKFQSMDGIPLPSGHSRVDALCQNGGFFDNDMFVNCDQVFHKKVIDSKLTEAQFALFPQKPPIDYFKDLIYLQMHFHLLLVQGFNYALPLLTTRFSFLNRIIYWPRKPFFGFVDKSKKLRNKLYSIKVPIVECLADLINAISEIENWILFSLNSYDVFNTFMKGVCLRKKDLFQELHMVKYQYRNFTLEHNRLVGAISKLDATFFDKNPNLLKIDLEADDESPSASQKSPGSVLSAFSNDPSAIRKPFDVAASRKPLNLPDDSITNTKSDLHNFNFLPSDFQTAKSKPSSESKSSKEPWFKKVKPTISVDSSALPSSSVAPSIEHSSLGLRHTCSTPFEDLYCHCVERLPSVEQIRDDLIGKNPGSNNQSNDLFLSCWNNNNSVRSKNSSIKIATKRLIEKSRLNPIFKGVEEDLSENCTFLSTIAGHVKDECKELNIDESFEDRKIILNMISTPLSKEPVPHQKCISKDYYGIFKTYLSSCGYQPESNEMIREGINSAAADMYLSLDMEQDILHRNFMVDSLNASDLNKPIIYDEESGLMESLKLYSKYTS